jgi:hypothetical protein
VTNIDAPSVAFFGQDITVDATIENQGASDTSGDVTFTEGGADSALPVESTGTLAAGDSTTVTFNVNTDTDYSGTEAFSLDTTTHGVTVDDSTTGVEEAFVNQPLTVGTDTEGTITANIQDGQGDALEGANVRLYQASDWNGDPASSPELRNVTLGESQSTVTFEELAVGDSGNGSTVDYVLYAEKDEFESDSTIEKLESPDNDGPTRVLTLRSALEPNVFGVGAFDSESERVTSDTVGVFANGQFDNQAEFAVFAQTQGDDGEGINMDTQPVPEDVTVNIRAANATDGSPVEFVVNQTTGETAREISVTITPDSPVANVDGNESTGVFSYETFNLTAVNATGENVDPLRNEEIIVWTEDIADNKVQLASELTRSAAPGDESDHTYPVAQVSNASLSGPPSVSANEDLTDGEPDPYSGLLANAFYFVEGDKASQHEVVDVSNTEMYDNATIWAAYTDGPQDLEDVRDFQNTAGESFLVANEVAGQDGKYVIPGLVEGAEFNVYVKATGYNVFNSSEVETDTGLTPQTLSEEYGLSENTLLADFTTNLLISEEFEGSGNYFDLTHSIRETALDYRMNVTALDATDEYSKFANVPAGDTTTVRVEVEAAEVGAPADEFEPISGQEVEVELVDVGDGILGNLENETIVTDENGFATVTFTAAESVDGDVNASATIFNSNNAEYTTKTGEGEGLNDNSSQGQLNVFTTGLLTGDVVDENEDSVPGATVFLDKFNTTSNSFEQIRDAQTISADANYVFADLETGETYRVRGEFEDDTGFATIQSLNPGTNTRDVVIEGLVLEQAELQLDSIVPASNVTAAPGETVTVNATLTNTGQLSGTETVQFVVGGNVAAEQTVTLTGGSSETVSLTVPAPDAEGDYDWSIQLAGTSEASDSYVLTVESDNSNSIVDQYDADNNGEISLTELSNAAADFSNDEISLIELSEVAAAYSS